MANDPTFGQLGVGGGDGNGTTWRDSGLSQVNNNNYDNSYDKSSFDNSSYNGNTNGLAFDAVPEYLSEASPVRLDGHFAELLAHTQHTCDAVDQTSQAYISLDWQHLDPGPPLQQTTTLIGNNSNISKWLSNFVPRPMTQRHQLMQLDFTASPLVDMPMQTWDLQDMPCSSLVMNEWQVAETLQLGQDAYGSTSSSERKTTDGMSPAHTPNMVWQQTGTGNNWSVSPFSLNSDHFSCDHPGCKATRPSQKELKRHQKSHKKPYMCGEDGCSKAFSVPAHLKRHRKTHNGRDAEESQRYRCSVCPKSYTRDDNLKRHIREDHATLMKQSRRKRQQTRENV